MLLKRRVDSGIYPVLALGFALSILFLLASGYVSLQILERVENRAALLAEQQRFSMNLIDEIQGEEAGLSSLFYRVASSPNDPDHKLLLANLDAIERDIGRTLAAARSSSSAESWSKVSTAVNDLILAIRRSLQNPADTAASEALYARHEILVNALSTLVAANYDNIVRAQREEDNRSRADLRWALLLLVAALIFSIACAIWTVRVARQVFMRLEWQARELSNLSRHVLETQEATVRNFSRELHDDLGQTLSAIEANLAAVRPASNQQSDRLEDCTLLVKDAISRIREMSQFLRPSMLDDFGLLPSLQWLAESFTQRTGIAVSTELTFDGRVDPSVETNIFRIAQEALTNVGRHSGATSVNLKLERDGNNLCLTVADNGHGFPESPRRGGFGLIGMRERMSTSGGRFDIRSTTSGVIVRAEAPVDGIDQKPAHSHPVGR